MPRPLRHDRAHDYPHLVRRWRALAATAGLRMAKYAAAGGHDLFFLASPRAIPGAPSIYLSAGIHGDEPGATEGLFDWAEKHTPSLRRANVLIFPCLNAWGLVHNSRHDADGRDLNRSYHTSAVPQIAAQMEVMAGRAFDLAITLHEDYDARGLYIYEVGRAKPYWGERLLAAAARFTPPDSRRTIEGRPCRGGLIRRRITPDLMPEWPEAFVLHFQNARRVFTVETPSEFHIDDRAAAHVAVLAEAVRLCEAEHAARGA